MENNVLSKMDRKLGNCEGKVTYLITFKKNVSMKKYGSKKDRSHRLSQKTNGRKYVLSI